MGRQVMPAALTGSRRRPFLGSFRWIWVLPPVALALVSDLARRVDGQLFQFLVDGPAANGLFPLLDPLQVGLPLPTGTRGSCIVGSLRGSHLDEKDTLLYLGLFLSLKGRWKKSHNKNKEAFFWRKLLVGAMCLLH